MTEPLVFEVLDKPEEGFRTLSYPRFWAYWSSTACDWQGIVARQAGGGAVGLALMGAIHEQGGKRSRRLLSVAVARQSRGTGIGRILVALAEAQARKQSVEEMFALYPGRLTSRPAFERLLAVCGFEAPRLSEYTLSAEVKCVSNAAREWSFLLERLKRDGFRSVPWRSLSEVDHLVIEETLASGKIHSDWRPYAHLDQTSLDFSLALFHRGDIAGWIVGRKENDRRVSYPLGYVLPRFQRRGYLVGGMVESCTRQADRLGGDSVAIYWTLPETSMYRFMERRLLPLQWKGEANQDGPSLATECRADIRLLSLKRL
ncbi:GNAT family N-acetyltransferase [Ensifer sp. ENS09]|uniref:GNAT family N-acetyltransferase n=1 Tax=Ensifer sp. ENS09 TaxID=2769263 RepID=UPI00177C142B|nr:GNAT family N-acetyltransferase [Ensifer sp. ENS09]MBD9650257.1 GNAT family N-acetyltransferase [Ensifer sp. ENS09]